MPRYIVGQTYTALISTGTHTFTVLEEGTEYFAGMFAICWDDNDEEWDYPEELDKWVQAAKEAEEEERYW